jgi:hypothetical protein
MGFNVSRFAQSRSNSHYHVMPGLVPGIQLSAKAGASGALDRGHEARDDTGMQVVCA